MNSSIKVDRENNEYSLQKPVSEHLGPLTRSSKYFLTTAGSGRTVFSNIRKRERGE